jgi:hypothetical protein
MVEDLLERVRWHRLGTRPISDAVVWERFMTTVPEHIGFASFAPVVPARGPMFGSAARAGKEFATQPVLSEKELYVNPE